VFLDGGVRRGTDVVKALALGAQACLVVRPWAWGLMVNNQAGITTVLDNLRREIDSCLGLIGRPKVADLDPSALDLTLSPWYPARSRSAVFREESQ
jgi:L-lactate dehydrogenase (cytochrome)